MNAWLPLPNSFGHVEVLQYLCPYYYKGWNCSSRVYCLLDAYCRDGFSNGKWYKPANMTKITDMVKTTTTCFRNVLFEIEVFSKVTPRFRTEGAGVTHWYRICVGKKPSSFARCILVPRITRTRCLFLSSTCTGINTRNVYADKR